MADILIHLSVLFLLGLFAYWLGLRTALPRVTVLILMGIAIGPSGFDLFAEHRAQWFPLVSDMALVMLGFLIGGSLTLSVFRDQGKRIVLLSLGVAVVTFAMVAAGLLALGQGLVVALLLAAIATATDPAATTAVVLEHPHSGNRFTQTLLGIVALDDAWGLLIFSIALVVATGVGGDNDAPLLLNGIWEIVGALLVGGGIGLPMAYLTGRIREGEPLVIEALGMVLLCGGLALKFQVSHLLAAIVMGATVANLAKHHSYTFRAIEGVEWPLLVLFFILAGSSLEVEALLATGLVGAAYTGLRVLGKVTGGLVTAPACRMSFRSGGLVGAALWPQAGVAVAMALTASQSLPEVGNLLLTITLGTTVIFELIGPVATRCSLDRLNGNRQPPSN